MEVVNFGFDFVWFRNITNNKFRHFSGRLNFEGTEIKKCSQNTTNIHRNILNFIKTDCGHISMKKSFLFNIDDSFIGNYQNIQIIIGPSFEKTHPDKKQNRKINNKKQS